MSKQLSKEQFALLEQLFEELQSRPREEHQAFLAKHCADDEAVREELQLLLEEDSREQPALDGVLPGDLWRQALDVRDGGENSPTLAPNEHATDPETIGPFRILGRLGSGGMGTVYLAQQETPQRRVAIKVLRHGLQTKSYISRLRREASLLAKLHHPGIAQVFEWGVVGDEELGLPYLVMELVEGLDLTAFAEQRRLSTVERVSLVACVCDAVDHAHQRGVIHRDLKPANILIASGAGFDAEPVPKVLDFGVARAIDQEASRSTQLTSEGQLLGTLSYMSPEQASGNPDRVDVRSDVWALGVILFELLSGELPHDFGKRTLLGALSQLKECEPSRLHSMDADLAGDLDTICARALEVEPERRYQTAAALAQDLRRFLAHQPIAARAPSTAYRVKKFARRHRVLVGGVLSTMLALSIGSVVATVFGLEANRNARAASASESNALRSAYQATLAAAVGVSPVGARDQLESVSSALKGWEWAHAMARLDPVLASYTPDDDATQPLIHDVAVTPEGVELYVHATSQPPGVRWVDIGSGVVLGNREFGREVCELRISSNGSSLAVAHHGSKRVLVHDLRARDGAWLELEAEFEPTVLDFSEDGRWLSVASNDGGAALFDSTSCEMLMTTAKGGWHGIEGGETHAYPGPGGESLLFSRLGTGIGETGRPFKASSFEVYLPGGASRERATFKAWSMVQTDTMRHMLVSLDGSVLVRVGVGGSLVTHDPQSFVVLENLAGVGPSDVACNPDAQWIFSANPWGVHVWEPSTGESRQIEMEEATRVAVNSRGTRAAAATASGGVVVSNVPAESEQLVGHEYFAYSVAYSPDGSLLASAGWDGTVRLWDTRSSELLETLVYGPSSKDKVYGVAFDASGSRVLADRLNNHRGVFAWDLGVARPEVIKGSRLPEDRDPDSPIPAWRLGLWEKAFIELAAPGSRTCRGRAIESLMIGHEAKLVAVGYEERVELLEKGTGRLMGVFPRSAEIHPIKNFSRCAAVDLSRDGKLLVSGSSEGWVRLWDVESGEELGHVEAHRGRVLSIAISPDGQRIASGGQDGALRLYSAKPLESLITLREHSSFVHSVRFSPDGAQIATASGDGDVRLWNTVPMSTRHKQSLAQARAREAMEHHIEELHQRLGSREAVVESLRDTADLDEVERSAAWNALVRDTR